GTGRFTAQLALGRARIRAGVPEEGVLEEARALPTAQRDVMRTAPLAVVDAEALWLGLPRPGARERLRAAFAASLEAQGGAWSIAEPALWLALLGEPPRLPAATLARLRTPYRIHLEGAWREAARAWGELGCIYEQAIALAAGDEAARREALALFDQAGAAPAAARLRRELRASGARAVPRGPVAKARAGPGGPAARPAAGCALLRQGVGTAQIAQRA